MDTWLPSSTSERGNCRFEPFQLRNQVRSESKNAWGYGERGDLGESEDGVWRGRGDFRHKLVLPLAHLVGGGLPLPVHVHGLPQALCTRMWR